MNSKQKRPSTLVPVLRQRAILLDCSSFSSSEGWGEEDFPSLFSPFAPVQPLRQQFSLRSLSDGHGRLRTVFSSTRLRAQFPVRPQEEHFGTKTSFFKTARFNINHLQPQKWDACPKNLRSAAHCCEELPSANCLTPLHASKILPTASSRVQSRNPTLSDQIRHTDTQIFFLFQPSALSQVLLIWTRKAPQDPRHAPILRRFSWNTVRVAVHDHPAPSLYQSLPAF